MKAGLRLHISQTQIQCGHVETQTMQTADCRLQTADCRLQTADRADRADCADCAD